MNPLTRSFVRIFLITTVFTAFTNIKAQDIKTAMSLTLSERYEDADEAYKKLIQSQPNNGELYYYYGENTVKAYQADTFSGSLSDVSKKASDIFLKGIAADSLNPLNYVGLGMVVLLEKADTVTANSFFAKASSFIPKNKKKYTDQHVQTLIKLGSAQIIGKKKRYEKGLGYLSKALEAAPNNVDVYLATGDLYIDRKDGSNAIKNYNKALYLDPKSPVSQVKIGNIYLAAKNLSEARKKFEDAKDIDSSFAPVYKGLGEMFSMAGYYNLSKANYKRFLDLSGNNIPAKVSYANSLYKSKAYADCVTVIDEIMTVDNSRNYLNRIAAYSCYEKSVRESTNDEKKVDYAKGLKYIETFFKSVSFDKIIPKDYAYYGRLLLKSSQDSATIEKGLSMLKKGYELDSSDFDLLSELAINSYYDKHYVLAIESYNKKIKTDKATSNDFMYLGKSYYQYAQTLKNDSVKMAQYNNAADVFTRLSKKEPDNMQALLMIANSIACTDPDSKLGLAEKYYEDLIQKASADTVKNDKELFEAYCYMGSYNLFKVPTDYNQAKFFYEKLVSLDTKNNAWVIRGYNSLAVLYYKKKDYATVKKYYQKILKIDPNNESAKEAIKQIDKANAKRDE